MTKAVHALIRGRVQGVFYRASTRERADELGVFGWVRNLPDGRVEGHFEGPVDAVDALVRWCHDGPPAARVDGVDIEAATPTGATAFVVDRTVRTPA